MSSGYIFNIWADYCLIQSQIKLTEEETKIVKDIYISISDYAKKVWQNGKQRKCYAEISRIEELGVATTKAAFILGQRLLVVGGFLHEGVCA